MISKRLGNLERLSNLNILILDLVLSTFGRYNKQVSFIIIQFQFVFVLFFFLKSCVLRTHNQNLACFLLYLEIVKPFM